MSRVLEGYANVLHPLEAATSSLQSRDKVTWTDDLLKSFKAAQSALSNAKTITLPQPKDTLWIVTDGSIKHRGIGATLYVLRDDHLLLAGFFNAKHKQHQVTWLPCEIEALAIGASIKHFAPFIVQSHHPTQVLSDSRPCVLACQKLNRGEFSTSSRVTSFLSLVSRYKINVRHISGESNLPSDFTSRNPVQCQESSCQICKFVDEMDDAVVFGVSVKDVLEGSIVMPFTNRQAWLATQRDCPDLRRTHAHLTQGTRPSKKSTKIRDVKRYINLVTVANDGLLVVRLDEPFMHAKEKIVIPRSVIDGFLTALHLRFTHPSCYQMKQLFSRYFYSLDLDKSLQRVVSACHHCQSLRTLPQHLVPQSTGESPSKFGTSFAADVMRRYKQYDLRCPTM